MNYKKLLEEFQKGLFIKTGDWRSDINQKFIPDNPTANLRMSLIQEEAQELYEELESGTLDGVRKELCDLLYVVFGTTVAYGLPVDEDFKKVHENNMYKLTTGFKSPKGKLIKAIDHPKVVFEQFELPLDYDDENISKVLP